MIGTIFKSILITTFFVSTCNDHLAQTTIIINPNNNSGTSGADGSFENATSSFAANGWLVAGGFDNNWYIGTTSSCNGTKGCYVGTWAMDNSYLWDVPAITHFYKDVTFPAGQNCIELSFNWMCEGEGGYDGFKVSLGSTSVTPSNGVRFLDADPTAIQLGQAFYNQQSFCATSTITIPPAFAGTTRRLVFSWENDDFLGSDPAATIDAISLITSNSSVPSCASAFLPANLATEVNLCSTLSWNAPTATICNQATSYDVYFGTTPVPPLAGTTTATTYAVNLNPNTTYYWQIRPKNAIGIATGCSVQQFTTSANPQYTLVDDATSVAPFNCVTLTTDQMSQRGCAWDANSVFNFLSNFSYDIDVNLGSNDDGADGLAFVIQNDPLGRCKCGTVGGALGAGGILNSVTVEIDTYMNFEDRDDFISPFIGTAGADNPDHLDIWFNGNINPNLDFNANAVAIGERPATPNAVRLQSSPGVNYNIENGLTHKFRISWNSATSTFTASLWNNALTVMYGTISSTFNPITIFGTNTPYFGFTGSTGGLSNQQIICLPAVLLPIELTDFQATCVEENATIKWTTETERDNDFFTLEKSCDGVNFTKIEQFNGAGNSMEQHHYVFTDVNQCVGANYYRLSQTDFNGDQSVLGIRSVKNCTSLTEVIAYPNPAKDQLTVEWGNTNVEQLKLFNSLGQLISEQSEFDAGTSSTILNVSGLARGVYHLKVYQFGGYQTLKILID